MSHPVRDVVLAILVRVFALAVPITLAFGLTACGGGSDTTGDTVVCGGKGASVIKQRLDAAGYDVLGVTDNGRQPANSEKNSTTVLVNLPGFSGGLNASVYCSAEAANASTSSTAPGLHRVIATHTYFGLPTATQATSRDRAAFDAFVETAEGAKASAAAGSSSTSAQTQSAPAKSGPTGCITSAGYGGLYSTVSAFNSNNNTTQPSQPIPGVAVYSVLSTSHGCVSAYSVDELTRPPQGARDIAALTDGIALPIDHTIAAQSDGCLVFSSATMTRASGFKFANAEGTAQSGNTPAHAEIHLTNSGSC